MLRCVCSSTYLRPCYAVMQSMRLAPLTASVAPSFCAIGPRWLQQQLTTAPSLAAKRAVVVQAAKKDPEELVKRISRGVICHQILTLPEFASSTSKKT